MPTAFTDFAALASLIVVAATPAPSLGGRNADDTDLPNATRGLRAAQAAVSACTGKWDGFALDANPGCPARLEAQWAATRRWTAVWLDRHPGAGLEALIADAKASAGLDLSAVRLDPASLLVGAQVDGLGAAFVLRRAGDGRFVTAAALDEPATWGGGGPLDPGAWRSDRADVGCRARRPRADWAVCGPVAPEVLALAAQADGARRFAVVGRYVKEAGATDDFQVSVWRWTGRAAEPLLTRTLEQAADEPVVADARPHALTLYAKGDLKSMVACGACAGRQVEITLDLPASGVRLAGGRSLTPGLDLVDETYDRLFRGQPAGDLATQEAVTALAPTVAARLAQARKDKLPPSLGLLMGWRWSAHGGVGSLCLDTDALQAPQILTVDLSGGRRRLTAVRAAAQGACDGPGSRS